MALIKCKECGEQVSDQAAKCPKCGFQLKKPKRGFFGSLFMAVFILFNVLMAFVMYSGMSSIDPELAKTAGGSVGTGIGFTMILIIWALGDIVLGLLVLFTKPK